MFTPSGRRIESSPPAPVLIGAIAGMVAFGACHSDPPKDRHQTQDLQPVTVEEGGLQTCVAPLDRGAQGPFLRHTTADPVPSVAWIWDGGVTIADLDGDGHVDVLTALERGIRVYHGEADGGLTDLGDDWFGAFDSTWASGTSVVDYDGDGDLDVYVLRVAGWPAPEWTADNELGKNRLLRNDGPGKFTEVTDQAGVSGCGPDQRAPYATSCWKHMTGSWGDIDGDGDLDLYVGDYGFVDETDRVTQDQMATAERDFLYLNDGDGTFTDASDRIPIEATQGYTYSGGLFDLDDDGDLDLYTVNDFGKVQPSSLLWNDGSGKFVDDGGVSGLSDPAVTGMGLGLADLNGDGIMDLGIPIWNDNYLYESLRLSDRVVWANAANARGFILDPGRPGPYVGWGTMAEDLDNDGDVDLVSQFGQLISSNTLWRNVTHQPDALYLNDTEWASDGSIASYSLTDVAEDWGVADRSISRGAAIADLNGDGWPDFVKRALDQGTATYLSRCGEDGWIDLDLHQPGTLNTSAIGAKVTLVAGGRTQIRMITAGGTGYASQGPAVAHFGLGDADTVDSVRIRWPDGAVSEVTDLEARQRVSLTR